MAGSLIPQPKLQFFDDDGTPLSGGFLHTYEAGTLVNKATYQNSALSVANENPVELNARGEAIVYGSGNYKLILMRADGTTVWDRDNVPVDIASGLVTVDDVSLESFVKNRSIRVLSSIAALRALDKTKYTKVLVTGYYSEGDGGGGTYYYDSSDTTSTDNGGTVIVASDNGRWKLLHNGEVSLKQFGAVGDGDIETYTGTDDTTAISNAFDAALLGDFRLYVPYGVYVCTGYSRTDRLFDLEVVGDEGKWPVFITTQAAVDAGTVRMIRIEPDSTFDTTGFSLAANIKPNQRTIYLNTVAGLEVGMFFQISSNTLWYHDPRGEDTKGELHLIQSIDSVAKTITFTDCTRDSYSTGSETLTLRAFQPNRFVIKNLHIKMPTPTGSNSTVGIQVAQCREPEYTNIKVEGMVAWGAYIAKSWHPRFNNIHAYGLGRANENGYGIQDKGCVGTMVNGLYAWGCRRGADFHGLTGTNGCVSRDWQVTNFLIHGGGVHYPDSSSSNESYGLGMHGPTENGIFHHGIITDCLYGINVRSRAITIDNVHFKGTMAACISASYGTGLTVRNCTTDRGDYPDKLSSFSSAVSGSGIEDFIRFGVSTGTPEAVWLFDQPVIIQNNVCKGLTTSFIRFMNDCDPKNIVDTGNMAQVTPGSSGTFYRYFGASAAVDVNLNNCYIADDFQVEVLEGSYQQFYSTVLTGYKSGTPDRAIKVDPKTYLVRINDDDVAVIRRAVQPGQRITGSISADATGSGLFKLVAASATLTSDFSLSGTFVGTATGASLTGTTGVDGNVTMGLTSAGDLWIENRAGSNRTFRIMVLG